ncbi:cilia- and flagella-associated protein 91-like [Hordeum vulgare subsp. vulgare]|uniref:cilia- and flagella-associated protein 91-like n=1 Tax=Hordeum vulgare subsp. vulgare TaxID=112509 RepID=UPI00162E8611|nr:cilia- and flagella-associated protein 91-like [Hordeum vulgare subsp. vulgare]
MSSFFGYDPYDYYYPASSTYGGYDAYPSAADAYFQDGERLYRHARRRAPAWNDYASYFPGVHATQPAARKSTTPRPSPPACGPDSFEIEVTGPDSDPPKPAVPKKPAPSAEEAAVRVQAAARGHMARRMVREVRKVERQADAVAARMAAEADALRADARKRVGLGEELMRLLLRLDGVRGAREYRRRVAKRVLALQDAVDALESSPAPAVVVAADAPEGQDAQEEAMAPQLPVEDDTAAADPLATAVATETAAMEVDVASPVVLDKAVQTETELVADVDKASEAEGEWEMVATGDGDVSTVEEDPTPPKPRQQEPAEEEEKKTVSTDGLDARKLMEMVAALCERSAQQCALIGALAERVDTLERSVRRVEEADRRRRRNKKLNKEAKKSTKGFYSD